MRFKEILSVIPKKNRVAVIGSIEMSDLKEGDLDRLRNPHTWRPLDDHVARPVGLGFVPRIDKDNNKVELVVFASERMTGQQFQQKVDNFNNLLKNPDEEGEQWAFVTERDHRPVLQIMVDSVENEPKTSS